MAQSAAPHRNLPGTAAHRDEQEVSNRDVRLPRAHEACTVLHDARELIAALLVDLSEQLARDHRETIASLNSIKLESEFDRVDVEFTLVREVQQQDGNLARKLCPVKFLSPVPTAHERCMQRVAAAADAPNAPVEPSYLFKYSDMLSIGVAIQVYVETHTGKRLGECTTPRNHLEGPQHAERWFSADWTPPSLKRDPKNEAFWEAMVHHESKPAGFSTQMVAFVCAEVVVTDRSGSKIGSALLKKRLSFTIVDETFNTAGYEWATFIKM